MQRFSVLAAAVVLLGGAAFAGAAERNFQARLGGDGVRAHGRAMWISDPATGEAQLIIQVIRVGSKADLLTVIDGEVVGVMAIDREGSGILAVNFAGEAEAPDVGVGSVIELYRSPNGGPLVSGVFRRVEADAKPGLQTQSVADTQKVRPRPEVDARPGLQTQSVTDPQKVRARP